VALLLSAKLFQVLMTNLLDDIIFLCVDGWNYNVRLSVLSDHDQLQNERCNLNLVGCCNYILVWLHLVSFSGDGWHVHFVYYLKYLV
jgi:hypothetical protein